jgi:glutathione synthase/RimK-type ligase-like ATP-grasp enzyme
MTGRVGIASCQRLLPTGDADDQLLVAACERLGLDVSVLAWSDPAASWGDFDLTVIRSTWDYTEHRDEFVQWLDKTPRLHNPGDVVVANTDKVYLDEFIRAGLPVVPTVFAVVGTEVVLPTAGEFVLKPSVGAGSRGAARFDAADPATPAVAQAHAATLHAAGRTVMVQPYLAAVDAEGETALVFIDGIFSHAIRKSPLLPPGARHAVSGAELYIAEEITTREPSPAEHEVAQRVIRYLAQAHGQDLLYARVDLLPTADGPVVIEVELSEPSLFLGYGTGAADRLATAIAGRIR